jgi:predicted nucleic acid-binding protein
LSSHSPLVTSYLVLVETWLLTNSRIDFETAERFLQGVSGGGCEILQAGEVDWRHASTMAGRFPDQTFSITHVISFDNDFVIYRYGDDRKQAFVVLR